MSAAKPTSAAAAAAAPTPAQCAKWHGYLLADAGLPLPKCIEKSTLVARPKCSTGVLASEFLDSPEVLEKKAAIVIQQWTRAERPMIYAGAGISTSSGIRDYASQAAGSKVQPTKRALTHDFIRSLQPTPAHRVLTAMERAGLVWGWLQQNHDGLAQKAGFPANKVNELHGSWLDKKENPIIKMSGSLRGDLFEWMLEMEKQCDFVFAVGTSFSGLNADRCAATCAARHQKRGTGQGLVVLSIQETPMDDVAAVRVFAKIDDFMLIVARQLGIPLPLDTAVCAYASAAKPVGPPTAVAWTAEKAAKRAAFAEQVKAQQLKPKAAAVPAANAATAAPAASAAVAAPGSAAAARKPAVAATKLPALPGAKGKQAATPPPTPKPAPNAQRPTTRG